MHVKRIKLTLQWVFVFLLLMLSVVILYFYYYHNYKVPDYGEIVDDPDDTFECLPGVFQNFPHEKCHKFYMCVGGLKFIRECTAGTMFDGVQLCRPITSKDTCKN
jgi:hypothetical protein